jgi:hypothetical protein
MTRISQFDRAAHMLMVAIMPAAFLSAALAQAFGG